MTIGVAPRLAAMMFLHYFVMGAWIVTLNVYLLERPGIGLSFSPSQVGWIYSTLAIGGFVAPFFVGILADRFFHAERVMAVLALLSALLLALAAAWCDARDDALQNAIRRGQDVAPVIRDSFAVLFLVMVLYSIGLLINSTLANVVAMRNLANPAAHFGSVRLWGTVGWIAAGFAVGPFMQPPSPGPLYLASVVSLLTGFYCFTLPQTPPKGRASPLLEVVGLPAITLFRNFSFSIFVITLFVVTVMQQWYGAFAPPFLRDKGVQPAPAWMTIAQAVEVACLLLIPVLSLRLGLKGVMMLGLLAWVIRNAAFTWGSWWVIILVGLPLHGASYTFFTILGSLYIDRLAPPHLRAGAQGLITLVSLGPGIMLGNQVAAAVVESATVDGRIDWQAVWFVPLIGCVAAMIFFSVFFRTPQLPEANDAPHRPPEPLASPEGTNRRTASPTVGGAYPLRLPTTANARHNADSPG